MPWFKRWSAVAVVLAALFVIAPFMGDALGQGMASFPHSRVEIVTQDGRSHAFSVEVATSPEQLSQGLMYRRSMAGDAGMLFDFGAVKPISMWMRNTLIPLDMVFIAADGRIVGVAQRAVPGSMDIISAPQPVRGVLELNGGTTDRLGIREGDRILHPLFAK